MSRKIAGSSLWEISVSCTSQKYDNPIFAPLSIKLVAHGRLKTKDNTKILALKVVAVAVAYERNSQEVPNQTAIWLGTFWYFEKLVAEERWSQPEVRLHFACQHVTFLQTNELRWPPCFTNLICMTKTFTYSFRGYIFECWEMWKKLFVVLTRALYRRVETQVLFCILNCS